MVSTLNLKGADLKSDAKSVPLSPESLTNAEELLAKLAQEATATTTNRPPGTAEADFSAGPRPAAPSLDIAPRPLGNAGEPRARGRRAVRGPLRFLLAGCVGVVATLAWQSYGTAGRQMVASLIPQLGLAPSPDGAEPLPAAASKLPAGAAVQAGGADAAPAQVAASDPVVTRAPASAEVMQQIEAMAHDITAMRQSMEQLTAAQSQMARTIAALQATEDARHEQPASASRPSAARKPAVPSPQRAAPILAPGPRPLSQSFEPSPGPPPPQPPALQPPRSFEPSSGPQPPRPPGSVP